MKRFLFQLCIIVLAMSILNCAYADVILTGTVETGQTFLERSARGGTVASVNRQTGSYVSAGDEIASLSLSQVYAPCAGTVKVLLKNTPDTPPKQFHRDEITVLSREKSNGKGEEKTQSQPDSATDTKA